MSFEIWSSMRKNTWLAVVVNKQFQYMYHSYQPYTGNTGLSNCILGMGNLTGGVHVHVKYEVFWKIISIKKWILKFILLVSTFWQLCETSEFRVVCSEPGANSTCLHQGADWDGPERNRSSRFLNKSRRQRSMSAVRMNVSETCWTERDPTRFSTVAC